MRARRKLGLAAGVAAVATGAAVGNRVTGFYRQLDFETGHDEQFFAETEDGWRISIYRYAARGERKPFPVVAGHGFAGSRLIWDLTPTTSLARYLADAGYDFLLFDTQHSAWEIKQLQPPIFSVSSTQRS